MPGEVPRRPGDEGAEIGTTAGSTATSPVAVSDGGRELRLGSTVVRRALGTHTCEGPSRLSGCCDPHPAPDLLWTFLWTSLWRSRASCGRPDLRLWRICRTPGMSKKSRENPCGAGVVGHTTSPTHSLRGERDRSETKIRTVPHRLAGEGLRWPGDGAAGIGGAGWIDRERHQYRSLRCSAGPRTCAGARRVTT